MLITHPLRQGGDPSLRGDFFTPITNGYRILISRIWKSTSNRFQAEEDQDETLFDPSVAGEFGFIPESVKKATDFFNSGRFFWYFSYAKKSTIITNNGNTISFPSRTGLIRQRPNTVRQ